MLHTFTISNFIFLTSMIFVSVVNIASSKEVDKELGYSVNKKKVVLLAPLKTLFSHNKHLEHFKNLNVSCTDCHSFSIKSIIKGPLAKPVNIKALSPNKKICHECHLGQVSVPRRSQCTLCHKSVVDLKPKDHLLSWNKRHGIKAQMDSDSCRQCHMQNECSTCHLQRDNMSPKVHKGNFKYVHSIVARANPQKCIKCHQSKSFCNDCHTGKRR